MIKAVSGGGGRGMRTAHNEPSLVRPFFTAPVTEAEKLSENPEVYIEKSIINPTTSNFKSSLLLGPK